MHVEQAPTTELHLQLPSSSFFFSFSSPSSSFIFLLLLFLEQGLIKVPRLTLNLLCSQGWPISSSQVARITDTYFLNLLYVETYPHFFFLTSEPTKFTSGCLAKGFPCPVPVTPVSLAQDSGGPRMGKL